jgi:hypothetical protein
VRAGRQFEEHAVALLAVARDGVSFTHTADADDLQAELATAEALGLQVPQTASR